jgi:hypothetical protein
MKQINIAIVVFIVFLTVAAHIFSNSFLIQDASAFPIGVMNAGSYSSSPPTTPVSSGGVVNAAAAAAVAAAAKSAADAPTNAKAAASAAAAAANATGNPANASDYATAAATAANVVSNAKEEAEAPGVITAMDVVEHAAEAAAKTVASASYGNGLNNQSAVYVVYKAAKAANAAGANASSVASVANAAAIEGGVPSSFVSSVVAAASNAAAVSGATPASVVLAVANAAANENNDYLKQRCKEGGIFPSNCRVFISYSSGSNSGLNFLNNINYTSTGSSSKLKANPLAWNIGGHDNFLPLLIYSNAALTSNSLSMLKSNLLDNEGGLLNVKVEYDVLPYEWVINKNAINSYLNNKSAKVPAFGVYVENFLGAKYIQATGITGISASNFGQGQCGSGLDAILPLKDRNSNNLEGTLTLRALYIGNYVSNSSLEEVYSVNNLPHFFGYGQVSAEIFIAKQASLSVTFSGLNSNKTLGNNGTFTLNLYR